MHDRTNSLAPQVATNVHNVLLASMKLHRNIAKYRRATLYFIIDSIPRMLHDPSVIACNAPTYFSVFYSINTHYRALTVKIFVVYIGCKRYFPIVAVRNDKLRQYVAPNKSDMTLITAIPRIAI